MIIFLGIILISMNVFFIIAVILAGILGCEFEIQKRIKRKKLQQIINKHYDPEYGDLDIDCLIYDINKNIYHVND